MCARIAQPRRCPTTSPELKHSSDARPLARSAALKIDVERALDKLPAAEREAIIHCYYLDLSHEEAAYVLQCPLGTVKTHVLRGRQKLKALLAAWGPDEPGNSGGER